MEYVRKRRLAYAMQDVNRGRRIIYIALDFEYGSERAFRRAFQNEYVRITNPFSNPFEVIPAGWRRLAEWVRLNGYMPDCGKSKVYKEQYWLEEKN